MQNWSLASIQIEGFSRALVKGNLNKKRAKCVCVCLSALYGYMIKFTAIDSSLCKSKLSCKNRYIYSYNFHSPMDHSKNSKWNLNLLCFELLKRAKSGSFIFVSGVRWGLLLLLLLYIWPLNYAKQNDLTTLNCRRRELNSCYNSFSFLVEPNLT